MDKFIEELLKAIPLSDWISTLGVDKKISEGLELIFIPLFVWLLKLASEFLWNHYNNSKAARNLDPWFNYIQVKAYRKHFVSTQFQNQSPTVEDDPSFSAKYVSKSPLIEFFLKTGFNEKLESDKFYLVLADSGMGKTTFMVNLFVQYHSFFNFNRKYKMRLYPFGDERILDKIKAIDSEEAKKTILLLDAFDEDKQLLELSENEGLTDEERFRKRMDEIIDTVRDFKEVVITSRTQYFPGQEDKPYELKIPRFDAKGFHILAKMYLSPFDSKEVSLYLDKKYGKLKFWNQDIKKKAKRIISNSPRLMVRPMLLSYIDYLVDTDHDFKHTYDIYETLIEKWLEREANKRKKQSDRDKFKKDLLKYSQQVALKIYEERKVSNLLQLEKFKALKVAKDNHLDLKDYEITGQSLLTRDASGNWKFAHKSIFEFFIAREAIKNSKNNPVFEFFMGREAIKNSRNTQELDFKGLDMAERFFYEVFPFKLGDFVKVEGGEFQMGDKENEEASPVHNVIVKEFYISKYLVTVQQFKAFIDDTNYKTDADVIGTSGIWSGKKHIDKKGVNWECDERGKIRHESEWLNPVIHVSWNDGTAFCDWLSSKTGMKFRLPTEAEWEFAARGGNFSKGFTYAGNNNVKKVAWYTKNSGSGTHPLGQKLPNELGLYDMSGNVWEWCLDDWHEDYNDAPGTSAAWCNSFLDDGSKVLRGGSWSFKDIGCEVSFRYWDYKSSRDVNIGFRIVKD